MKKNIHLSMGPESILITDERSNMIFLHLDGSASVTPRRGKGFGKRFSRNQTKKETEIHLKLLSLFDDMHKLFNSVKRRSK